MKRLIFLLVLFTLTTAFSTSCVSVKKEDSLTLEVDTVTNENETEKIFHFEVSDFGGFGEGGSDFWSEGIFNKMFNTLGTMVIAFAFMPILFIVAILFLIVYFIRSNRKREKQKQELIMKFVESGQPIPEKLNIDTNTKNRYLKSGIMWFAIGIGLFLIMKELAIIPLFVGAAYIIIFFIEERMSKNKPDGQE